MARVHVEGAELEYTVAGIGQPVLLIHGGLIADSWAPLLRETALTDQYCLISFHRRGYGDSSRLSSPFTIADQAKDCLALLDHVALGPVHVVGHSYGGLITIQLALMASNRVRSLCLIEPPLLRFIPSAAHILPLLESWNHLYQTGNKEGAIHNWLTILSGADYRVRFDTVLPPGWYERLLVDIDTVFPVELPAFQTWKIGPEEVKAIRQPMLSVLGTAHPVLVAQEIDAVLHAWFPQTETFAIADSWHWPQLTNPEVLAKGLAWFFSKYSEARKW